MRWVCHLKDHHFRLKQLLKFRLHVASVLSVSRQGSSLLNIPEVWPRPFLERKWSSEKNTVDHFIGHILFTSLEGDKRPD